MSDDGNQRDDDNQREEFHSSDQKDWPYDLSELQSIGEEIITRYEKDNPASPRAYPTAEWLVANGYANLRYILEEYHDMGLPEFFTLLTPAERAGFEWKINAVGTIERAETFLSHKMKDRRWADSTEKRHRYRLNTIFERYRQQANSGDLYSLAQDESNHQDIYNTVLAIVRELREERDSDQSVHKYLRIIHRWLEWLARTKRIPADPLADIEDEFKWDWSSESGSLNEQQVCQLWEEAKSTVEYLIVIGLCIWGLRPSELASVSLDQLELDSDDPRIEFRSSDSRKNGIGSVSLLFGLEILAERLDKLGQNDDWDGYLFPGGVDDGHLHKATIRRRFKLLAERANIKVNGETPTPKAGRSYYFTILTKAETSLLERVAEVAPEQGSKDPETIVERYLSEEERRRYRRIFFRIHQKNALPSEAYDGDTDLGPRSTELDEYIENSDDNQGEEE